jgi:hypothetical protein
MTEKAQSGAPDSPALLPDDGFGALVAFLIREGFQKVESLNQERLHRYYLECKLCGGTDELRPGRRTDLSERAFTVHTEHVGQNAAALRC